MTNKTKTAKLVTKFDETLQLRITEIEEAKQLERKRIGQQLHDDLASSIAATLNFIVLKGEEQSKPDERAGYLLVAELLSQSYEKTRAKSHELYLEDNAVNFRNRLAEQIALLFSTTSIKFNFQGDINGTILSPEMKTAIVMILKEAISNVIKHAKATEAEVFLYDDQAVLVLEIADNGIGFPKATVVHTVGLKSIQDRVGQFNGSVEFLNDSGKGAVVKIKFPMTRSNYSNNDDPAFI